MKRYELIIVNRIINYFKNLRDRITVWAWKTQQDHDQDEESDDEESIDLDSIQPEGTGMRVEMVLRALIHLPIRWFRNTHHARKLEKALNKDHPECPVRVKVVDKIGENTFFERTFDVGLVTIPSLFIISFFLWTVSRFTAHRWLFELLALVTVLVAIGLFLVFGLLFVFAAFFGYEFEYLDGRKHPKRSKNPIDSYTKLA